MAVSYFPHIFSCFSHDDFTRKERASVCLYYLVKNTLCISQALFLQFIEANRPYAPWSSQQNDLLETHLSSVSGYSFLVRGFYHPRFNSYRREFFQSLTLIPYVLYAGWVSQNRGYFLFTTCRCNIYYKRAMSNCNTHKHKTSLKLWQFTWHIV